MLFTIAVEGIFFLKATAAALKLRCDDVTSEVLRDVNTFCVVMLGSNGFDSLALLLLVHFKTSKLCSRAVGN